MTKSKGPNPAKLLAQAGAEHRAKEALRAREAHQRAFDEKTARIRALRLAKEAADREAAVASAAAEPRPGPAGRKTERRVAGKEKAETG